MELSSRFSTGSSRIHEMVVGLVVLAIWLLV